MRSNRWVCTHRKADRSGRLGAALFTLSRPFVDRLLALVLATAAGAALGACGSDDGSVGPAAAPPERPVGSNILDESPPVTHGSADDSNDRDDTDPSSVAAPPQSDASAAENGPEIIEAAPIPGGYAFSFILESDALGFVLGMEMLPDGSDDVVLVAREGRLWRAAADGGVHLYGDISERVLSGGEQGLLGLAFSPTFASDGLAYLHYNAPDPARTVISRFQTADGSLAAGSEEVLLQVEQPFPNHNGGQIAFGPDGLLYIALGDGGAGGDPLGHGQDMGTLLGAVLRIDVSEPGGYRIPADNPFVGVAGARPEIYAYGLRNPWRFSFDSETGELWLADVGQDAWEEVDTIVAGGNYGWNTLEGFACFASASCSSDGFQLPRAVYDHGPLGGCSITGGYVYRGVELPELDGWYIYGDFCSARVWAVDAESDGPPVVLAEAHPAGSITSFGVTPAGEVAVLTMDGDSFTLTRLDRAAAP